MSVLKGIDLQTVLQKRAETEKKLNELRETLLKTKDIPLNERPTHPFTIHIEYLKTYPGLERQHSKGYLESLKKSIKESGLISKPLCTMDFDNPIIIGLGVCGIARIKAMKELGYSTIEVMMQYLTLDEAFQKSITENEEREELNPMDRADQFSNWIKASKIHLTQKAIADRFGKSETWVYWTLKLLKLPEKVQQMIREQKITFLEAQKILRLEDPKDQITLAELCAEGLSDKALEKWIEDKRRSKIDKNNLKPPEITPPSPPEPPPNSGDHKPPKTVIISKDPADKIVDYIKKTLDEVNKTIENSRPDELEPYFKKVPTEMQIFLEKCPRKCSTCKVWLCAPLLKTLKIVTDKELLGVDYQAIDSICRSKYGWA